MWPFKKKEPPLNPNRITEDWAYGDLAENTSEGPWWSYPSGNETSGPGKGDVNKVLAVKIIRTNEFGDRWALELGGFAGRSFDAHSFRKVPPLNSECEADFAAQIKALKPKRVRA